MFVWDSSSMTSLITDQTRSGLARPFEKAEYVRLGQQLYDQFNH